MLDNRDVMDTGFEVRPGEDVNGLTLTYTDRPAELSGVLTDAAARPASDYFIILFAADPQLWRVGARRIQYVRPGTDGRFQFSNLPAGKYLLAALTDVAPGEWLDPAFLKPLMTAAIEARVSRLFRLGGAHAVAALAYGTATVPRVDKIVGPGNRYVAAAKAIVVQLGATLYGPWQQLRKEGETGRKKLNQYTRYLTVAITLVQLLVGEARLRRRSEVRTAAAQPVGEPAL